MDKSEKQLKKEWELAGEEELYRLFIKGDMSGQYKDEVEFRKSGQEDVLHVKHHLETFGFEFDKMSMLEIGCGPARMGEFFHKQLRRYVGIDISMSMIERAKQRCPEVDCRGGNSLKGYQRGFFDMIFSYGTLQHVPKNIVRRYFREAKELLDHGFFVFQLPIGGKIDPYLPYQPYYTDQDLLKDKESVNSVSFRDWSKPELYELIYEFDLRGSFPMNDGSTFYIVQA